MPVLVLLDAAAAFLHAAGVLRQLAVSHMFVGAL